MAIWASNLGSLENATGIEDIKRYIYKLNKDLEYMFSNLTPEDNNAKGVPSITVISGGAGVQIEAGTTVINIIDADSIKNDIRSLTEAVQLLNSSMLLKANKATLASELDVSLQDVDPIWEGKSLTDVIKDIYSKLPT